VNILQSYNEITSDAYLAFIRNYVVGIGPWKDTIVPPRDNYLGEPTDLVARAHALNLQVIDYSIQLHILPSLHRYNPLCEGLYSL
jgi:glycerophosphoryl diester phosphodiesterase